MKKGWKIFLIACGSVFVAGLALSITGAAMGATFSGVNQAFGYERVFWDDDYDDYDDYDDSASVMGQSDQSEYTKGDASNTYEFSHIQEIDVEAAYIEVDVKAYDKDVITVDTSGLKNGLEKYVVCKSEGNELKVETTNHRKWEVFKNNSPGRLVIWIPKEYAFLEASFDVGAGYLKIDNIEAGELSVKVGAGKIVVDNFVTGNLDAECGAGQSILTGSVSAGVDIECGVGETKVTLNGNQNDYDYQLKCSVGRLLVGNEEYTGLGSERRIDNGTGRVIEVDCGLGNVEVAFNAVK